MRELQGDIGAIDKILQQGAEKARALTEKHLAEIKDIVGLWRPGSV
jgi:tryptophanyl-tRNA synthetase